MENAQLPADKELILEKHCPSMSLLYLDDNGRAFRERILAAMEDFTDKALHAERNKIQKRVTESEIEWASKLLQVEQENKELKQWKSEASELLNPILDYGQSKEVGIPLGRSITNTVLDRCKQFDKARALLEKTAAIAEPMSKKLYNEIKTFLDGTK